jgi:hypothetical protein
MCITISLADVTRDLYLLVVALLVCAQLKRQTYASADPRINLWSSYKSRYRRGLSTRTDVKRMFIVTLRGCLFALLLISPLATMAQVHPGQYLMERNDKTPALHTFFDNTNLKLQGINAATETIALLTIQSHDNGGEMAPCTKSPCSGALEARGRTLDPYEKHFESYGYGWGAVYRYGGGVGLNLLVAYAFHATGHHKLERWVPVVAIAHAQASTGYALTGSRQGKNGW